MELTDSWRNGIRLRWDVTPLPDRFPVTGIHNDLRSFILTIYRSNSNSSSSNPERRSKEEETIVPYTFEDLYSETHNGAREGEMGFQPVFPGKWGFL